MRKPSKLNHTLPIMRALRYSYCKGIVERFNQLPGISACFSRFGTKDGVHLYRDILAHTCAYI